MQIFVLLRFAMPLSRPKIAVPGLKPTLWKGPESTDPNGGITFSMLSRFLCDRERFRVLVVDGLRAIGTYDVSLSFGSMWHTCEEALAAGRDWRDPLKDYTRSLCRQFPMSQETIDHWYNVARITFPLYVGYWEKHRDTLSRKPLLQEQVFSVPYQLPSGRVVRLRGRWDSVDQVKDGKDTITVLQENKTKGRPDEERIKRQLTCDLQTMIYVAALDEADRQKLVPVQVEGNSTLPGTTTFLPGRVGAVRYNVVRRPLGGGKGNITRKKPTKSNPNGESKEVFYNRLAGLINDDPASYFMRWNVPISTLDIQNFKMKCLTPLLEQLCQWWKWVSSAAGRRDPFAPAGCGMHWLHPFGVYNTLNEGGSTDLDHYLMTGSTVGLEKADRLFTELED